MVANSLCVREARGGVAIGLVRRVVAAVVVGAASFTAAGPAGAQTTGDAEAAFLARVTAARQAQGLPPLPVEYDLVAVARAHSADMASLSRLFHNTALAQQVQDWISVGENVGAGSTVDQIHQTLMSSAVHRGDILNTRYTGIGIGVVQSGGTLWVTQVFRQRSGTTAVAPPPSTTPPVTDPPVTLPVEITPVTAPATTAAPAPRVAAPPRSRLATTVPSTTPTTVTPPTTEPPVPEFAPAAASGPAAVELAGPAAEVDLGSVAPAAVEPVAARPELVAASLVAVTLLWMVGFKTVRLAVARRRPAYLHRAR